MHINCRSVSKNFNSILDLLDIAATSVTFIAVTETWLTPVTESNYVIPNYHLVSQPRLNKPGGGVGIYILNDVEYILRKDLTFNYDFIECIFVELIQKNNSNIIIGCVYRPPGTDMSMFNSTITDILQTIDLKKGKTVIIAGDFNIDLIKTDKHLPTSEFSDNMSTFSLLPVISLPTRVTEHTSTLIDNFFVNNIGSVEGSAVVYHDVSDHFPIALKVNTRCKRMKSLINKRRSFSNEKIAEFNVELSKPKIWENVIRAVNETNDTNIVMTAFCDIYLSLFEKHFPEKCSRNKYKRTARQEWMTKGLINSCIKKAKLYKKFKKTGLKDDKVRYLTYLGMLKKLLRVAESNYYKDRFGAAAGDMRRTWSLLNTVLNKNNLRAKIDSLNIEDKIVSDNQRISDHLNHYFSNIGENLAAAIPKENVHFNSYLTKNYPNSFVMNLTNPNEIINLVSEIKNKSSSGMDRIPTTIMKATIRSTAYPLSAIINHSILNACFPDVLKIARVCPLFKNGIKSESQNYRPISVLPSFSKIFEKVISCRLTNYLAKNDILTAAQFGFRKNHSCYMALLDLYDKISLAGDRDEFAIGIFIDLSKAFDTINHNILLRKLHYYGVRGIGYDWFASYLSNRKQYVDVNGYSSVLSNISCGVPQGSILGPLLFIIYINDITSTSNLLHYILFADDTNLFYSSKCINDLQSKVNEELRKLAIWFRANLLSLNVNKTNFIIFGGKHYPKNMDINIDGNVLNRVECTKFLGVYIDSRLRWKDHITHVASKIAKSIGVINHCKFILPRPVLFLLYYTIIYPYLIYCNIVWGCAGITLLQKLKILQKRALRIITHSDRCAPSSKLFYDNNILKLGDIYILLRSQFMYKLKNHLLPYSCLKLVNVTKSRPYCTRLNNYFEYISCHTVIRQNSITFDGPRLWDSLPLLIQNSLNIHLFNRLLKSHLISGYKS